MSWKETAKLWESFDALEEGLKVQLQSMDDTQKEEAFYTPLEFGTRECVELWDLGLIE